MSSKGRDLKDEVKFPVRAVIAAHAFAFAGCIGGASFSDMRLSAAFRHLLEPVGVAAGTAVVMEITRLFVLGLLSARWRDRIAHMRFTAPLPGSRAFSKIAAEDYRVDLETLRSVYGPLPADPVEQNRLFYRMSKAVGDDPGVCNAHKSYLAARDIAVICWLALIPLSMAAFILAPRSNGAAIYAAGLALVAIAASVITRNYGVRFVQNVLAAVTAAPSISRPTSSEVMSCT